MSEYDSQAVTDLRNMVAFKDGQIAKLKDDKNRMCTALTEIEQYASCQLISNASMQLMSNTVVKEIRETARKGLGLRWYCG